MIATIATVSDTVRRSARERGALGFRVERCTRADLVEQIVDKTR